MQNFKNITGSQIGAYFGYSLASGDIDGDGTDDIIIGAPMFTKKKSDGYEHGRVYVIYQGRDRVSIGFLYKYLEISIYLKLEKLKNPMKYFDYLKFPLVFSDVHKISFANW